LVYYEYMDVLIATVVGLILGSFASVVIERLGVRGGIVAGRSECPRCQQVLAWYDLIPLASFLWLRGRCRYCAVPIAIRYLCMELGMAFALGSYVFQNGWAGGLTLLEGGIIAGLVMLLFFDLRHQLLPDELTVPTGLLAAVRIGAYGIPEATSAAVGAVVLILFFGLLHTVSSGRWIGFGDVGLGGLLGLVLGWPYVLFVLVFAVWTGVLVGVFLMWLGRATMKTALPFGTFLNAMAVGALIEQDLFQALAEFLHALP